MSRLAVVRGSCLALAGLLLACPPLQVVAQQPPPPAAAPDPATLFNNAVGSFDRGDFQGAITAIDALLKNAPRDLPPAEAAKYEALLEPMYFTLGAAHYNLKQYPEAITALKDYLARYPKSIRAGEVIFSLAQAQFFSQDYRAAVQSLAALENSPALREQALLLAGLAYKEGGDDARAIATLEKLAAGGIKSPLAARGAMQLISLYSRQKQPDKALKTLSSVQANIDQLENVVELNSVALEQGDAYLQNNANAEALTCYRAVRTREQVVAIERARIAALQKRLKANEAAVQGKPKEVLQYAVANRQLQRSVAEDQGLVESFEKLPSIYPKVLFRMGRAYTQMGKPWEAIVAYQDSYDRATDPADREPALFAVLAGYTDVNQTAAARALCEAYLKEFPQGANQFTVGYLLGATALQENDAKAAETYFGRMLAEQPESTMRERMRFLLGNALLAEGRYDEAKKQYAQYQHDFPQGAQIEETAYRSALAALFAGNYEEASKGFDEYLKKYPAGDFISDAKYRLDVCKYAAGRYDEVAADAQAWLKQYPGDQEQGEVDALLGDVFTATGKSDDALAAYQESFRTATTDEVVNYSLTEAGKILQKRGDWEADAAMFQDFVKAHPDQPAVVMALAQIGRAKTKQGKVDEAKHFLADTLQKYIGDRKRGSVEQILDQLATLCVRKKPRVEAAVSTEAAASPVANAAPAATPTPDPGAELDELLAASLTDKSPTAQARVLYAKAQLARLRRQPAEAERNLLTVAAKFKPDVLSPTLLGAVGDALLAKGKLDEAAPFFQALMDDYPKSDNVDFAYAGLGEIAFQRKRYDKALDLFKDGTDKIAANQKVKDLTVGEAKTLAALGKFDEAKKIFEQSAAVREWRGETTAFCIYSLGEIEAKQGHWAEANAYYQRVYVAYQRFLPWVAKAYLGSADSLEKLGKKEDAIKTYQEMLRNPKMTDFAEAGEARQRLQALGST